MLDLRDVHKRFGDIHAVRGISLHIAPGQVAGLLGPNGAGKSTTIRMILGALPPTSGSIHVDGLHTLRDSARVRSRLGYLPEANPLYPEMRVREYLRHRARLYGLHGDDASTAVERATAVCALFQVRHQVIGTLSKGYRQRVGLAAAIIHRPRLIILDEPASGLDPAQIADLRTLVRDLAESSTVLIVSHMLPEVERTCDRVIMLGGGRVLADGAPVDLLREAAGECIVEARREPPAPPPSISGAHVSEAATLADGWTRFTIAAPHGVDPREPIAAAFGRDGWTIRELRPRTTTLESLYLRLIGGVPALTPSREEAAP